MQKCVKITISGVSDLDLFYQDCKKMLKVDGVEGVVQPADDQDVLIIVHGPKERVDEFVIAADEVTIKYAEKHEQDINFFVEPFFKEENYRGLFRFIKGEVAGG